MRKLTTRPALALSLAAASVAGAGFVGAGTFSAEATPGAPIQAQAGVSADGVDHSQLWFLSSPEVFQKRMAASAKKIGDRRDASGNHLVLSTATADKVASFHDAATRGTGFRSFTTQAEAEAALETSRSARTTRAKAADYTIDNDATVKPWLDKVQHEKIKGTIEHLSTAYPNRHYSTSFGKKAPEWLKEQWTAMAKGRNDVTIDMFTKCPGCKGQPSPMMTIKGAEKPDEYVVIGGHIDSISSTGRGENMKAPGADDDASGVAVATEIARVALESGWKPKRSVVFVGYAAEEIGLVGSHAVADDFKAQGKNVTGVLQLDMTNYDAKTGVDIAFMTDYVNEPLTQFGEKLFDHYLAPAGLKRGKYTCGYGCSDHASWTEAGFPSMNTAEPKLFPKLHTPDDNLKTLGNTAQPSEKYAKFGLVFLGEVAKTAGGAPAPAPTPAPTPSAAAAR